MEYDKWTRKYVGVLKEWGFEPLEKKATSHRKWRYSGSSTERPVTVIVPSKIKNSSRAATIANVKRQLSRAGADRSSINRFDRIALGLIQVEASDTIDVLEEKLEAAISHSDHLIVAKIAFELGKRAGAENARSTAIEKRQQAIDAETELGRLVRAIEDILLCRLQAMFNREIERNGPIELGRRVRSSRASVEIAQDLVDEFGFSIASNYVDRAGEIEMSGQLVGSLTPHFEPWVKIPYFNAAVDDEDREGWLYCRDGDEILRVQVSALFHLTNDALEVILQSLEEEQTMMRLSGKLDPLANDD